ncbi:putative RNA-binding protein COG1094 [Nanoarchaeota archaeon]
MYSYETDLEGIDYNKLKNFLEEKGIKYNKKENKITIYSDDYYFLYKFDKFIKCLKVGFDIDLSKNILYSDWDLLEIDLKQIFEKKINHVIRIKGRIIGEKGKALKELSDRTNSNIIIKDRYIYLLGDDISIRAAYEGIRRLINGEKHEHVYEFLDRYKENLKNKEKEINKYTK